MQIIVIIILLLILILRAILVTDMGVIICSSSDGLMLEISASLSLHSGNLTHINFYSSCSSSMQYHSFFRKYPFIHLILIIVFNSALVMTAVTRSTVVK